MPERKPRRERWEARPAGSAALRVLIFIAPPAAAFAGAMLLGRLLPQPSGALETAVWWAAFIGGAALPFLLVAGLARRLVPLAALLRLTMLFPDQAPSRFRIAVKAGRTRDIKKMVMRARERSDHTPPVEAAETVLTLITALGSHDRRTRGHSERVRAFADLLAEEVGIPPTERDKMRWGALLHDVGKLEVSSEILNKPGRPDEHEWEILRQHPAEGLKIAAPLAPFLGPWSGAIAHHHERFEGSGYPYGLAGTDISLGGRILAVADSYETMTAARPYKKPMSANAAREELARCAGTHFDPTIVRAFLNVSVGKLWMVIGAVSFLAQVPALGRVLTSGSGQRFGRAATSFAGATAAIAVGMAAGLMDPGTVGDNPSAPVTSVAAPADRTGAEVAHRPRDPAGTERAPATDRSPAVTLARSTDRPATPTRRAAPSTTGEKKPPSDSGGSEPPAENSPRTLSAAGVIRTSSPLTDEGAGVTETEFERGCRPPSTQGLDGWVFTLPDWAQTVGARMVVAGGNLAGVYELDVRFFSARCGELGELRTPSSEESGRIPADTRHVLVNASVGAQTQVLLVVTEP